MADEQKEPETAEAAMNVALAAERTAAAAVEACRREAERQLEAARNRARELLARADRRIARLHETCAAGVQRQVAATLAEGDRIREDLALRATVEALLDEAAATLAEQLATAAERPDGDDAAP